MRLHFSHLIVLLSLAATFMPTTAYAEQLELRPVILSEDRRIDGGGSFASASAVAMAPNGQVTFEISSDQSIWIVRDGEYRKVVAGGMDAPGVDGATFEFTDTSTNRGSCGPNGEIMFEAELMGEGIEGDVNSEAVYSEFGGLHLVARQGDAVPDLPGVVFRQFDVPLMTPEGHTVFHAWLEDLETGERRGHGVYIERGGELEIVAAPGQPAPGHDGMTFYGVSTPAYSQNGSFVFTSRLKNRADETQQGNCLWLYKDGELSEIAYAGMPVPDVDGRVFLSVDDMKMSSSGECVFVARWVDPEFSDPETVAISLWRYGGQGLQMLLEMKQPAIGFDNRFFHTCRPGAMSLGSDGRVAFVPELIDSEGERERGRQGLWVLDGGELCLVAGGDDGLATEAGYEFHNLARPRILDNGAILFMAKSLNADGTVPQLFEHWLWHRDHGFSRFPPELDALRFNIGEDGDSLGQAESIVEFQFSGLQWNPVGPSCLMRVRFGNGRDSIFVGELNPE